MIAELRCTNCLAPLQPELATGGVVSCPYCRTVLRVSGFGGSVLASVDFADPKMPGWVSPLDKEKELLPGPPPRAPRPARGDAGRMERARLFGDIR